MPEPTYSTFGIRNAPFIVLPKCYTWRGLLSLSTRIAGMELSQAQAVARTLMDRHGLQAWDLTFDRAKRRAGLTDFRSHTISLSAPFMVLYDEARVQDVILHEIAHARVGRDHGHDATWKAEARRLGTTPTACITDGPKPPAPYLGICPNGHQIERFRAPRKVMSCAKCSAKYNPAYAFKWYKKSA